MNDWRDQEWAKDVCFRFGENLDNIQHDDKKMPTLPEAVAEAKYVKGLYYEGGTVWSEELSGDHGKEAVKEAKAVIRSLDRFIKKYS